MDKNNSKYCVQFCGVHRFPKTNPWILLLGDSALYIHIHYFEIVIGLEFPQASLKVKQKVYEYYLFSVFSTT